MEPSIVEGTTKGQIWEKQQNELVQLVRQKLSGWSAFCKRVGAEYGPEFFPTAYLKCFLTGEDPLKFRLDKEVNALSKAHLMVRLDLAAHHGAPRLNNSRGAGLMRYTDEELRKHLMSLGGRFSGTAPHFSLLRTGPHFSGTAPPSSANRVVGTPAPKLWQESAGGGVKSVQGTPAPQVGSAATGPADEVGSFLHLLKPVEPAGTSV